MIYLGIDPGYGRCGYGLVENQPTLKVIAYGCIETLPGLSYPERYTLIRNQITGLIREHKPAAAGIEFLFFGKNVTTGMRVSECRGVLLALLFEYSLPIYEPKPQQVKSELGYGRLTKAEIQENIRLVLGLEKKPKPDDAADALAVALFVERNHRMELAIERSQVYA